MSLTGNILITGGSGTLGHAIVRTAETEGWDCTFTIYSRSELRQAQMRQRHPACRYVLGDVRDAERLAAAVAGHDLVIHAAAMKRIPECEQHPGECYATNVQGSANVIRACQRAGVARLVGISTDKACRAITTYGASKLLMEGLFRAQREEPTICTLVRYGNVVASNGSVIPLWRQQAREGRPLTITDARCTRFWMAESDAVELVQAAAAMDASGVLIPKMGALPIIDMARIIAPGCDTIEMGLRSCEKLHEDLVHIDEQAWELLLTSPSTGQQRTRHYILDAAHGTLGHSYTSETAPRLSADQFRAMLAEAEAHDG
jgi:UDP-N-acetylglucosamine 4,6-dehydratase